jgi:PAS domain-containing protein
VRKSPFAVRIRHKSASTLIAAEASQRQKMEKPACQAPLSSIGQRLFGLGSLTRTRPRTATRNRSYFQGGDTPIRRASASAVPPGRAGWRRASGQSKPGSTAGGGRVARTERDITEQKRAHAHLEYEIQQRTVALRKSQEELAAILHTAADAIITMDNLSTPLLSECSAIPPLR